MIQRERIFLAGAIMLALAFIVVPVAAAPVFSSISLSYGTTAGGTSVTITGTGFSNVTSVTFDGIAGTLGQITDTSITVTTPAHSTAGAVNVVITTPEGTATASNAFTYTTSPAIALVNPAFGYSTGIINNVNIVGSGFSTSPVPTVVLKKSGYSDISATNVVVSSSGAVTTISCTFDITSKTAGYWNLVVTNPDGQSATLTNGFEIRTSSDGVTVTSITPTSGTANSTVSISNLAGTGFAGTPEVYLKRSGYNNIVGSFSRTSSTKLTGSFDLDNQVHGPYQVCVRNSGSDAVCGLTFTIVSENAVNGSLYFSSTPSGASIYVDSTYKGKTPMTLDNVVPGTHTIKIEKAQYVDYTKSVTVVAGEEVTVSASLTYKTSATTATPTTVKITTASLPPTTVKSTAVVPTAWPSDTPAPESPVSLVVIVGALAAFVVLVRKEQ